MNKIQGKWRTVCKSCRREFGITYEEDSLLRDMMLENEIKLHQIHDGCKAVMVSKLVSF